MRQLSAIFFVAAACVSAQFTADSIQSIADKKIELAKQELQKISELVKSGALPRIRLEQAGQDVADAQDDAVLARTLYGDLPVQNLTEQMADDMVAAAQRR